MVTQVTKFITDDGKEFTSESEALDHELEVMGRDEVAYRKYIKTSYSGSRVVEKYGLRKYGTWKVEGEDPNCDLGGHHHNPFLGYFEGTLETVIRKAVTLPHFYSWGGGGRISLQEPPEVVKL